MTMRGRHAQKQVQHNEMDPGLCTAHVIAHLEEHDAL